MLYKCVPLSILLHYYTIVHISIVRQEQQFTLNIHLYHYPNRSHWPQNTYHYITEQTDH